MPNDALFKNKYRVSSIRWKGWNYSNNGYYFLTICTKNRQPYFGNIKNGKMFLSWMGKIVHASWLEIPNHFDNATADVFVVMPDHFHGIIRIKNIHDADIPPVETLQCNVSTRMPMKTRMPKNINRTMKIISPKRGSISIIIRSFKSACTKKIHLMEYSDFSWQPRYHDRVIRDEFELNRIRKYIRDNPKNWKSRII